jgi:retinol dehydrogenase-12
VSRYGFTEYGHSKLAQIYHTFEWAKNVPAHEAGSFAVHPGAVATHAWRHSPLVFQWVAKPWMRSCENGAKTVLFCANSPELNGMSGVYSENSKVALPAPQAFNALQAAELMERTREWLRPFH